MLYKIIYSLIICFTVFSCTTTKTFSTKHVKNLSHSNILDSISYTCSDINTYSSKFSVNLKSDKELNLKGNIRITKDSIIWISLTPGLGFEVARVVMKQDSLFVLDRVRNTYYFGTYSYFKQLADIDINFNTIQSLFLNDLLIYNPTIADTAVFNKMIISNDNINNKLKLQSLRNRDLRRIVKKEEKPDLLYQDILLNENWKIEETNINDFKFNRKVAIQYSAYNEINNIFIPSKLFVDILDDSNTIKVTMEFNKQEFNKENKYQFSIPNKYDRVKY